MLDERFVVHRFKSTRFAVLVGTILMFVFFTYHIVRDGVIRWDLFTVMIAMAVAKVAAMIYLRRTN